MLAEKLAEANRRADALTIELEQSKSAHTKTVEDLQKRLDDAKKALEENVTQHSAREKEILSRLETQSRRFVSKSSPPCCFLASCFGLPFFFF
jgi:phosphoribosylaminoimidazole carboxylase (NCAIR synthetase)